MVGRRHADEVTNLAPDWWGIKIATVGLRGGFNFKDMRRARINQALDILAVSKLLWRDEALTLLDELGEAERVRYKHLSPPLSILEPARSAYDRT